MSNANYINRWLVPSYTERDKTYEVILTEDGDYICDCPAATFRDGECKHVRDVREGQYAPFYTRKSLEQERRESYIKFEVDRITEAIKGSRLMGKDVDIFNKDELIVAAYYYGAINPPSIFSMRKMEVKDGDRSGS